MSEALNNAIGLLDASDAEGATATDRQNPSPTQSPETNTGAPPPPLSPRLPPEPLEGDLGLEVDVETVESFGSLLQTLFPGGTMFGMRFGAQAIFEDNGDLDLGGGESPYKQVFDEEHSHLLKKRTVSPGEEITCLVLQDMIEPGEEVITLPCGHHFSSPAIMHWLTTESPTCPSCRYALPAKEIRIDSGHSGDREGTPSPEHNSISGEPINAGTDAGDQGFDWPPADIGLQGPSGQPSNPLGVLGSILMAQVQEQAQREEEMMLQQILFETFAPHAGGLHNEPNSEPGVEND